MADTEFKQLCARLQEQFLCCYPIAQIDWLQLPNTLDWEQQAALIECTYAHKLNQKWPIKNAYQLQFLKRLLSRLEQHGSSEVHDVIYESFCAAVQSSADDKQVKYAYKHYVLTALGAQITLRESNSFVSAGTTGLCSWQASLALADYLLHNAAIVMGKNILELGAGTGLCGIIAQRCLKPNSVLLTDGSADCVQLMGENIALNFSACDAVAAPKSAMLLWADVAQFEWVEQPQLLIAADVVYNETDFPALCGAIDDIFERCANKLEMLLAATVRNAATLEKFVRQMQERNYTLMPCDAPPADQSYLHWDRTTPIQILAVKRDEHF